MTIIVKYFASLREQIGIGQEQVESTRIKTVKDVLLVSAAASQLPDNTLVAVNQHYGSLDSPVSAGDEVAFFPPVTGG
ncbi:unnamed protein product [Cyprideis torosa]|uniref:Uncharacterized protein n=1 Tax=Cyprideis torosa TaxID=163714 RepID=A0A7R8WVH9_9CRUS|nr:unnamed protein product [Cyprideis torosa]CAG0907610.1 unnamed protein product [Cyprideis torosa]